MRTMFLRCCQQLEGRSRDEGDSALLWALTWCWLVILRFFNDWIDGSTLKANIQSGERLQF